MAWTGLCVFWSSLALWTTAPHPIPFQLHHDYIAIAEGSIGALESLKFVLDTGSNPTVIHTRVAEQLRLSRQPDAIHLVGGTVALESAILDDLRLGGLGVRRLEVLVKDLSPLEQELGSRIDAILGLDVLARRNLTIDYARKQLHLDADADKSAVSMDARRGFVAIPVEISGKRVRLVLDTGARGIVLFENRIRDRFPRLRVTGARASTGLGGRRLDRRVELSSVRIGEYEIGPVQATLAVAAPETLPGSDGLLGVRALGVQLLAVDFVNSGVVLRGSPPPPARVGPELDEPGSLSPFQASEFPGYQK